MLLMDCAMSTQHMQKSQELHKRHHHIPPRRQHDSKSVLLSFYVGAS